MTTYNDAQCDIHNIQWDSREIGTECPACEAAGEARRLLEQARKHITDSDLLHQIKWYLGETDIPYHPIPEDMK